MSWTGGVGDPTMELLGSQMAVPSPEAMLPRV